MRNPFPGLRPFESDEEHLFFGREVETDALLRRLRTTRLLAVVGASGSGKSSLVRSGLVPALQAGFMAGAGSSWRIATCRPGEDPTAALAAALAGPDVLGTPGGDTTDRVMIEATLRRGTLGLVEAVRLARLPAGHNVLVLVDQFEELFRFRDTRVRRDSRDEAIAFVRLLLDAARQQTRPIYVVLTMRSDFISECMHFPGLPEAVNAGLFLVGRLEREALRSAIVGPVAVAGGAIAPRLVHHVLNDVDDDRDQLPLVQHALMRTWGHWQQHAPQGRPMDVDDYDAVGGVRQALSRHAEEAFGEAAADGSGELTARIFRALTDTFTDPRGIRRPTTIGALCAICEAGEADVVRVVDTFRGRGRSFLMPPTDVTLTPSAIVDIAHESLMRCWSRLRTWAEEERAAAAFYVRLAQAAAWHGEGTAGLWRDPELALALRWRDETRPTTAWAARYDHRYDEALAFLEASRQAQADERAAEAATRRARLRRARIVATVLAVLLVIAIAQAWRASRANARAEANLALARAAVDESLTAAERDPASLGADVPALQEFRGELLQKAERFYSTFLAQQPDTAAARADLAAAQVRLGHIDRLLQRPGPAERRYREAIAAYAAVLAAAPRDAATRRAIGNTWNWLGETLRPSTASADEAGRAFDEAQRIQQALLAEQPDDAGVARDLARTLYNRGILRATRDRAADAEADFREAIRLLSGASGEARAVQELARALNNLAGVLSATRPADAQHAYARAIALDEQLVEAGRPGREVRLELATFHNNAAALALELGDPSAAERHSRRAVALLDELARLAPTLGVERADAHALRASILDAEGSRAASAAFAAAVAQYETLATDPRAVALPAFHQRAGDLILGLVSSRSSQQQLSRAVAAYLDVATRAAEGGTTAERQTVAETLERIAPHLPPPEAARVFALVQRLR